MPVAAWVPYAVMAIMTAASAVYQHQQEVKMKRKQREQEAAAREAAYAAIDVTLDTEAPHRVIYGRTRVGGVKFYRNTSGTKGKYYNVLQTIAGHEVDAIESVWHDNVMAKNFLTGETSLKYPEFTKCWPHLGTANQTASAEMVDRINDSVLTGISSITHRGQGIAFIGSSLEYDINDGAFPGGAEPSITCIVRGKKILDLRTNNVAWSDNPALVIYDMLTSLNSISTSSIDAESFISASNYCDESLASDTILWSDTTSTNNLQTTQSLNKLYFNDSTIAVNNAYIGLGVTGSGIPAGSVITGIRKDFVHKTYKNYSPTIDSGTDIDYYEGENSITISNTPSSPIANYTEINFYQTETKRFTCNGSFTLDSAPCDYIQDVLDTCEGKLIKKAGKYYLYCGWKPVVGVLDETFLRDEAQLITLAQSNISDTFNTAVASFLSKKDFWNATDTVPIRSEKFLADDNHIESQLKMDYVFTDTILQAYRLQKYELFKSRYGRILDLKCSAKAKQYDVGDNIIVKLSHLGWTDNEHYFTITSKTSNDLEGIVDLTLRETSPVIYNQNATMDDVQHPISTLGIDDVDVIDIPSNVKAEIINDKLHITWINEGEMAYSGVRITIRFDNEAGKVLFTTILKGTATEIDCEIPDLNGIYFVEVSFISKAGKNGAFNYTTVNNQTNTFDNKVHNTSTQVTASLALSNSIIINARLSQLAQTTAKNIKKSEDFAVGILNQYTANSSSMALLSSSFSITQTSHSNQIEYIEQQVTANSSSLGSVQAGIFAINNTLTEVSGGLLSETSTRQAQISSVSSSLLEKANVSTVTTLSNTVSTLSSSLASQLIAVTSISNNASASAAIALNAITNSSGSESSAVFRVDANGIVTGISLLAVSGSQTISTVGISGDLQSKVYTPGSAGWKISGDGNVEFNNAKFRGHLYASKIASNSIIFHPDYPTIEVPLSSVVDDYHNNDTWNNGRGTIDNYPSTPSYVAITKLYGVGRRYADSNIPANKCFARNNMNFSYSYSGWFDLYGTETANLQPCFRINGGNWTEIAWPYGLSAGGNQEVLNVTWAVVATLGMTDYIEFGVKGYGPRYQASKIMVRWENI